MSFFVGQPFYFTNLNDDCSCVTDGKLNMLPIAVNYLHDFANNDTYMWKLCYTLYFMLSIFV